MKIEYPDEREIARSVDYICEKGNIRKNNFFTFLRDMTNGLGLSNIFYGIRDAMLIACFVLGLICMLMASFFDPAKESRAVAAAFVLAPAVFITMFILSYIKEKTSSTYSVKMVCKYNVNHLLAYRMFVFSLLGSVADAVYLLVLCIKTQIDFVTMLCVSLASLFIFSLILIFTVLRFSSIAAPILVLSLWITSNGALWLIFGDGYGQFIRTVPVGIYLVILFAAAVIYINRLTVLSQPRRNIYANG